MDMSQYLEIFIEESKEHLDHMNQVLLDLETNPQDLNLLNEIFRIAHTIKGMSGTMGFNRVATLTHEMESVMDLVRSKQIAVSGTIVDILFECFDNLGIYIEQLESNGQEGNHDSSALVAKLKQIVKTKSLDSITTNSPKVTEEVIQEKKVVQVVNGLDFIIETDDLSNKLLGKAKSEGFNIFKMRIILTDTVMLKSARAFIIFNTLDQFGEVVKSYPTAEEIEDEKFDTFFEIVYLTKLSKELVYKEIMSISEIKDVVLEGIDTDSIESFSELETTTNISKVNETISAALESNDEDDTKQDTSKKQQKTAKTVRVDINRLDNLMNLVSELIIIKTRLEDLEHNNKQNSHDAVEYLERITTSLHDAVMKVRMVPVERVFNRFPRMVRDLAKDLGKEIKLNMTGEETEVDRTVIDEIGDPLIHLIRNSIDHGIESPEKRRNSSKPSFGTVNLRAYPDGNTVVIEVEDDGHGIDHNKILKKAIEKGVITEKESEGLSENEIILLLFKPGFSTAEKLTDLSGRGVGLDVVKTKIESLNGTVEVQTAINKGSKFIIRLPLTLAIIQALMVIVGDEKYALPLNNIKEITTIKQKDISLIQTQEVVLYRNKTLPILRLDNILETSKLNSTNKEELVTVIVRKGDQEVGLIVDSLVGQQEIVIKSLGKYLTGIRSIAGATILGNGSVALIVDPNQLF